MNGKKKNKINHQVTKEIVCPYCGTVERDSWERPENNDDIQCLECGSEFSYSRDVFVTYTTWKKEDRK